MIERAAGDYEKRKLKQQSRRDVATMATVEAREDETMLDADASAFCYDTRCYDAHASAIFAIHREWNRRMTRNIYAHVQRRQWCVADGMYYAGGHRRVARPEDAAKTLRAGNKRFVQELRLREIKILYDEIKRQKKIAKYEKVGRALEDDTL